MQNIIQVEPQRGIYGRELYAPRNDVAKKACRLLRQKFLAPSDIAGLKSLGFVIQNGITIKGKFIEGGTA